MENMELDIAKFNVADYSIILSKITNTKFRVITKEKLDEISDRLPEIDRVASIFSKTNSQTSAVLMSIPMLDTTPLRYLRQISAQLNQKREALKENIFRLKRNRIKRDKLISRLKLGEVKDKLEREKYELVIDQINAGMADGTSYIEAAIKEVGSYLQMYEDIIEYHNIPRDWDEKDFEKAEIKHHITAAFREALKDRMNGPTNHGTCEYFEQLGIEPILAYTLTDIFIKATEERMVHGNEITIKDRYKFYEDMYNRFKDNYKVAMERIGVKSLYYDKWLLTSKRNED